METIVLLLPIILSLLFIGFMAGRYGELRGRNKDLNSKLEQLLESESRPISIDFTPVRKMVEDVPTKVLQSITSSSNNLKGNLGELIGYLKLQADYDRVFSLGGIVDFVCIRFDKPDRPGVIDMIDIKTGGARLSKDQRAFHKLIEKKKINFVKMHINTGKLTNDESRS